VVTQPIVKNTAPEPLAELLLQGLELAARREGIVFHRFEDGKAELHVQDNLGRSGYACRYFLQTSAVRPREELTREAARAYIAEREQAGQPSGFCDGCLHGVPFAGYCEECGA
jgi:hypothetical protein